MILVTGASGTVGSELVRLLRDQGQPVRAGVHAQPLAIDGVEAVAFDFDRPETIPPALEGVNQVYLLSFAVTHERSLVEAARRAGIERIVKHSAFGAAEQEFLSGRLHREVELEIEASGMAWTFLRPNYFMQNFITVMGDDIRQDSAIYDSAVGARISYIDARDIARAAAQVLTERGHEGTSYELSGPAALTNEDAAAMLSVAVGRTIRYVPITDDEFRQRCLAMGLSEEDAEQWVDVNRQARATDADSLVTTDVEDILGRPATPFSEFCRDHAFAFQRGAV
jgi:uncharacterized protein YbjT (DUF2867 family)